MGFDYGIQGVVNYIPNGNILPLPSMYKLSCRYGTWTAAGVEAKNMADVPLSPLLRS